MDDGKKQATYVTMDLWLPTSADFECFEKSYRSRTKRPVWQCFREQINEIEVITLFQLCMDTNEMSFAQCFDDGISKGFICVDTSKYYESSASVKNMKAFVTYKSGCEHLY
jgi:hypothetical protein